MLYSACLSCVVSWLRYVVLAKLNGPGGGFRLLIACSTSLCILKDDDTLITRGSSVSQLYSVAMLLNYLKFRFTVVNSSCNSNRYLDSLLSSPCSARKPFPRESNTCPTLERSTLIAVNAVCSCSIFVSYTKIGVVFLIFVFFSLMYDKTACSV